MAIPWSGKLTGNVQNFDYFAAAGSQAYFQLLNEAEAAPADKNRFLTFAEFASRVTLKPAGQFPQNSVPFADINGDLITGDLTYDPSLEVFTVGSLTNNQFETDTQVGRLIQENAQGGLWELRDGGDFGVLNLFGAANDLNVQLFGSEVVPSSWNAGNLRFWNANNFGQNVIFVGEATTPPPVDPIGAVALWGAPVSGAGTETLWFRTADGIIDNLSNLSQASPSLVNQFDIPVGSLAGGLETVPLPKTLQFDDNGLTLAQHDANAGFNPVTLKVYAATALGEFTQDNLRFEAGTTNGSGANGILNVYSANIANDDRTAINAGRILLYDEAGNIDVALSPYSSPYVTSFRNPIFVGSVAFNGTPLQMLDLNGAMAMRIGSGFVTSNPVNAYEQYAVDYSTDNAGPAWRTENGDVYTLAAVPTGLPEGTIAVANASGNLANDGQVFKDPITGVVTLDVGGASSFARVFASPFAGGGFWLTNEDVASTNDVPVNGINVGTGAVLLRGSDRDLIRFDTNGGGTFSTFTWANVGSSFGTRLRLERANVEKFAFSEGRGFQVFDDAYAPTNGGTNAFGLFGRDYIGAGTFSPVFITEDGEEIDPRLIKDTALLGDPVTGGVTINSLGGISTDSLFQIQVGGGTPLWQFRRDGSVWRDGFNWINSSSQGVQIGRGVTGGNGVGIGNNANINIQTSVGVGNNVNGGANAGNTLIGETITASGTGVINNTVVGRGTISTNGQYNVKIGRVGNINAIHAINIHAGANMNNNGDGAIALWSNPSNGGVQNITGNGSLLLGNIDTIASNTFAASDKFMVHLGNTNASFAGDTDGNFALTGKLVPTLNNVNFNAFINTAATNTFSVLNGTPPNAGIADGSQMFAADEGGSSIMQIRNEDDTIIKLYQQAAITDPAGGATIDAEARTALISVLDLLRNNGLLAA